MIQYSVNIPLFEKHKWEILMIHQIKEFQGKICYSFEEGEVYKISYSKQPNLMDKVLLKFKN